MTPEIDYFHRILYGVSKLATEYIKEGEGYGSIQKIISISIVYFRLGQGKDYIYEYKGEFIGKHYKDSLNPSTWQRNKYKVEGIADILPKYYILKVNNFNKVAEDTLDQWIYLLKNSEFPENCTAKGLKAAGERLRIDSLSPTDRKAYDHYKESRWIEKNVTETAELIGETRGKNKKSIEIAKNLIIKGLDNPFVAETTGLDIEIVENLHQELK